MVKSFGNVGDTHGYQRESPYPHIVVDGFLETDILHNVQKEAFEICTKPSENWRFGGESWSEDEHEFQQKKRGIGVLDNMPFHMKSLVEYLNSREFIDKICTLTGKPDLVGDPTLTGGGLHETKKGGYLGIHHDFNEHFGIVDGEVYYRQVNLLLYINPHWDTRWGGHLEMWNKDMSGLNKVVEVVPNRCVIFNIDGAPHGHPSPLNSPSDISRRSIAMYYYSKEKPKFSTIRRAHWETELKDMV